MITRTVTCPDCRSEAIIRFGKTTNGYPRYRCKDCRRTFSDAPERGHTERFKQRVLASYQERMSMRGIARVYHISRNTLTAWLKEKGED
jgi:insertion element IS1 protein InsB